MKIEDKFIFLLQAHSKEKYTIYMMGTNGPIHITYQPVWSDGLSNKSRVRLINPKLGMSTAPNGWEHLIQLLALHDVSEEVLTASIERELHHLVLLNNRLRTQFEQQFGTEYVENIVKGGEKNLFNSFKELFKSLTPKKKPKFEIIDGGKV